MFLGRDKKFFLASALLAGSMVGVGIFGLPYAFAQAGFWTSMALLILITLATLVVDFMYGEVILRTHAKHQLIGYAKVYLNPIFQKLLLFSIVLLGYVGLLAYIIISGDFLNTLLSPFFYTPISTYSILFAVALSVAVLRGLKTVSFIELFFCCLFVVIVGLIFVTGVPAIDTTNFLGFEKANLGLPYGILLFAFGGLIAVPIQRQLLVGREKELRPAIGFAVLFVALLYIVFTTVVVGISGTATTADAVSGLYQFLGSKITILSSLFGIFAITTSFLMLASALINTFHLDFGIRRFNAWLITVVPPLVLFFAGIRSFIGVISLAGGVALALEQILVIFLYARAKSHGDRVPEYSLNIPAWLLYTLILVFTTGIFYFLLIR
ncbi:MAG: aromatic amino acid transport family protein [Patescibacteria group bacterium]